MRAAEVLSPRGPGCSPGQRWRHPAWGSPPAGLDPDPPPPAGRDRGRQLVQDLPPAIEQSRCDVCGAVEAGFRGADLALQQRLAGKAGNQQVLRLIP